jgi:hypothetical protein
VRVVAHDAAPGNAFVPRLFAAAKIAELERTGGALAKPMIVELSKRFAVASQFTSLLVLESEAMFKAFGLDRGSVAPTFTGEVAARARARTRRASPGGGRGRSPGAWARRKISPRAGAVGTRSIRRLSSRAPISPHAKATANVP